MIYRPGCNRPGCRASERPRTKGSRKGLGVEDNHGRGGEKGPSEPQVLICEPTKNEKEEYHEEIGYAGSLVSYRQPDTIW